MERKGIVLAAALTVAGCGGGGDDGGGFCVGTFQGGDTGFSCTTCSGVDPFVDNPVAEAIDNNGATFRAIGLAAGGSITIRAMAPGDMSFPAGVDAGALIRFAPGVPVSASYSLYNGNTPVPATEGGTIATGSVPPGAGSATYYPVTAAATFDRIDLTVSVAGVGTDFRLHEFCGDR